MNKELLQQSIAALKAGRKSEARRLLEQVAQADPRSEAGWLWLSGAVDSDEERRFCLTQVIAVNPHNAAAQRGLQALGAGPVLNPVGELAHPPLTEQEQLSEPSTGRQVEASVVGATCPRCNTLNPPGYRFCDRCGAPLERPVQDDVPPTLSKMRPGVDLSQPDRSAVGETRPGSVLTTSSPVRPKPPIVSKPVVPTSPVKRQPESVETKEAGKGKWFSSGCAGLVIVCFFLPWITVSCTNYGLLTQDYIGTWSGYEIASGGMDLVRNVNLGAIPFK